MSILPQFINLDHYSGREYRFPLPPVSFASPPGGDSPSDITQAIAIYHYRGTIKENLHQFELQGVEIRDTRLDTCRRERAAWKAEAMAARKYIQTLEAETEGEDFIPYGKEAYYAARAQTGEE